MPLPILCNCVITCKFGGHFTAEVLSRLPEPWRGKFHHDTRAPRAFKRAPESAGGQRYITVFRGVPRSPETDIGVRRKRIDAESFKTSPFSTLNILLASAVPLAVWGRGHQISKPSPPSAGVGKLQMPVAPSVLTLGPKRL